MIELSLERDDVGRLLAGVRERRRKAERGLEKFKDNFDPVKGHNLREGYDNSLRLERYLQEKMDEEAAEGD